MSLNVCAATAKVNLTQDRLCIFAHLCTTFTAISIYSHLRFLLFLLQCRKSYFESNSSIYLYEFSLRSNTGCAEKIITTTF